MRNLICFFTICFILSHNCIMALNFRGGYDIRKSSEKSESFKENFSFFKIFQPTKRISLSSSLRYTKTKSSTHRTEIITPTANFNLSNDIFNLNMSGTMTETRDTKRNDLSTNLINISLSSFYKKILDTKITYTKSNSRDNGAPHKINFTTTNYGITVKRSFFKYLNLTYDLKKDISSNRVNKGKVVNKSNTFIASLSSISYRKRKFFATFSSNFNYKKNKTKSTVFEPGYARFPVNVNATWDFNLKEPDNFIKKDNNIIISVPEQGLDLIYFYTDNIFLEDVPYFVKWNIYWSETGEDDSWELLHSYVSLPFRFSERFDKKGFLKFEVVDTNNQKVEITTPLVECYILEKTDKNYAVMKVFSRSFTSNYSMGYNFTEKIESFYNFNFSLTNPSPGYRVSTISHSLTTRYNLTKLFSPSFMVSQNLKYNEHAEDTSNIDLSITNNFNFLNTLSSVFSYSKSISYTENRKTTAIDTYTISTNAKIYPDLIAKWDNSFAVTKNYLNSSTSDVYTTNLGIVARFTPSITVTTNYSLTKNLKPTASVNQTISLNIAWRISEMMFINIGENVSLPESGNKDFNHNLSFWVAFTKKIQYNFTYSGTNGKTKNSNFSNFLSWKINRNFSLKLSFNQQFQEGDYQWDTYASISFTF